MLSQRSFANFRVLAMAPVLFLNGSIVACRYFVPKSHLKIDIGITAVGLIRNFGLDAESVAHQMAGKWAGDRDAQALWRAVADMIGGQRSAVIGPRPVSALTVAMHAAKEPGRL